MEEASKVIRKEEEKEETDDGKKREEVKPEQKSEVVQLTAEDMLKMRLKLKASTIATTSDYEELAKVIASWERVYGDVIADPEGGVNVEVFADFAKMVDPKLSEKELGEILSGRLKVPWKKDVPPDFVFYCVLLMALATPFGVKTDKMRRAVNDLRKEELVKLNSRDGILKLLEKMRDVNALNTDGYYYLRGRVKKWQFKPVVSILKELREKRETDNGVGRDGDVRDRLDLETALTLMFDEIENALNKKPEIAVEIIRDAIERYRKYLPVRRVDDGSN